MPSDVVLVPLVNGGSTTVDADALHLISPLRWFLHSGGYAYNQDGERNVYLHRLVMGEPDGYVDHINRDKLDNRRSNLRVVSNSINMLNAGPRRTNRSGHVGICSSRNGKWRAYITVNSRQRWLGTFADINAAVSARRNAERMIDPGRVL